MYKRQVDGQSDSDEMNECDGYLVLAECHAKQHHCRVADRRKRRCRIAFVILKQEEETCAQKSNKQ